MIAVPLSMTEKILENIENLMKLIIIQDQDPMKEYSDIFTHDFTASKLVSVCASFYLCLWKLWYH